VPSYFVIEWEPRADKDVPFSKLRVGTQRGDAQARPTPPTQEVPSMASDQMQGIITMLRTTAADRGDAEMTVEEWRAAYQGLGGMLPAREGVPVVATDAGGVPAEWIGADEDGPVVVYFHGGGYCIGSLDTHRAMLTHLAAAIGGRVLAVDYAWPPSTPTRPRSTTPWPPSATSWPPECRPSAS
jgi:acetyl esterase/lipase